MDLLAGALFTSLIFISMAASDPPKPIGKEQAERIAGKTFASISGGHDLVMMKDKTVERPFGWVFFATTRKYLETHDPRYLVPGMAPLVVLREDGSTEFLPTSLPPARAIELYEKRWDENRSPSRPGAK